ncbi:WXG100 family type VII secretion target [Nocardia barduliensis]|uniref:WXG100 family type VII secretion target n=1 Tax=Nocardia barduliensis TaxID=2736643 RepID=UPI0015725C81|nr:WXG100 family type VII secretion target [Nocardia barduliensis]
MVEQFSADLDRLRAQAPAFDQIGSEVAATVQRLRTTLASEGAPWGDDDAGRAFAEYYVPEHKRTMADLNSLVEVLQQAGTDLRHLAENFENQDRAVGQRIRDSGNALQNGSPLLPVADNATLTHRLGPSAMDTPTLAQPSAEHPLPTAATHPAQRTVTTAPPDHWSPDSQSAPAQTPGTPANGSAPEQQPSRPENNPPGRDTEQPSLPGPGAHPPRQADPARTRPAPGTLPPSPWAKAAAAANQSAATKQTTGAAKQPTAAAPSTPWTRPTAGRPPKVSAPDANTPGSPPRMPGRPPARPDQKDEKPNRKVDASAESVAARLARELAERHGVRAFGFDTPDIAVEVLTEIVAAVDDVLPRYPRIALRAIGIEELTDGETARLEWDSASPGESSDFFDAEGAADQALSTARVVLALSVATDPNRFEQSVTAADNAGLVAPGCARRPVYSAIVRELGRALDRAGGFRARAGAQRALLTAYLPQLSPEDKGSLNRTVSGFQEWRAQLGGRSFDRGRFHPAAALAEAFTDVILNGVQAAPPAQVLHRLLVTTANSPTP